jgi:hypothetical protein
MGKFVWEKFSMGRMTQRWNAAYELGVVDGLQAGGSTGDLEERCKHGGRGRAAAVAWGRGLRVVARGVENGTSANCSGVSGVDRKEE